MISPRRHAAEQILNVQYVYDWVYMSLYWTFFTAELIFVPLKYGPFHDRIENSCFTFGINPDCPQFKYYWIQLGFYTVWIFLIFVIPMPLSIKRDCRCAVREPIGQQMKRRYLHCNQLLFPLVILFCLILIEAAIAITKKGAWYTLQIAIDLFGYVIWFIFVFVPPTVIRQFKHYFFQNDAFQITSDEKFDKRCILRVHVPFMIVALCNFLWVLYSIFGEDFNYEVIDEDMKLIFVQILLENVVVLEWIHFIIEELVFHNKEQNHNSHHLHKSEELMPLLVMDAQEEDDEKKDALDDDDNGAGDKGQSLMPNGKQKILNGNPNLNARLNGNDNVQKSESEVLTNWYVLGSLFLFVAATICFDFIKLLSKSSSNFQMFYGDYHDEMLWVWIAQPSISFVLFLIIFWSLFEHPSQAKALAFNTLWFPALVFLAMFVAESIFGFWVNQWYFLQLITDGCGYFIFFVFSLFFVRYVFGEVRVQPLNCCHKTMMRTLGIFYVFLGILLIIRNLTEDLKSAREAVDIFDGDKKLITALVFVQIILENALIIEWYHVLTHKIGPEICARSNKNEREDLLLQDR